MMFRVLLVLFGGLTLAVAAGWLSGVHPLFEAVTNVRAQFFPIAVILVVGFAALRSWYLTGVAAAVLLLCLSYVMP